MCGFIINKKVGAVLSRRCGRRRLGPKPEGRAGGRTVRENDDFLLNKWSFFWLKNVEFSDKNAGACTPTRTSWHAARRGSSWKIVRNACFFILNSCFFILKSPAFSLKFLPFLWKSEAFLLTFCWKMMNFRRERSGYARLPRRAKMMNFLLIFYWKWWILY